MEQRNKGRVRERQKWKVRERQRERVERGMGQCRRGRGEEGRDVINVMYSADFVKCADLKIESTCSPNVVQMPPILSGILIKAYLSVPAMSKHREGSGQDCNLW